MVVDPKPCPIRASMENSFPLFPLMNRPTGTLADFPKGPVHQLYVFTAHLGISRVLWYSLPVGVLDGV